jgi:hypothetical protein
MVFSDLLPILQVMVDNFRYPGRLDIEKCWSNIYFIRLRLRSVNKRYRFFELSLLPVLVVEHCQEWE